MILADDKGNKFNVDKVIAYEKNTEQLRLLCKALYRKLEHLSLEVENDIRKSGGNDRLEEALKVGVTHEK